MLILISLVAHKVWWHRQNRECGFIVKTINIVYKQYLLIRKEKSKGER